MIKIGLINLWDYEDWIKSLGYDREWTVQEVQARVWGEIVKESAKIWAFAIPFTYDSYIVILNSIGLAEYEEMTRTIMKITPVGLKRYIGIGRNYLEALSNLSEIATSRLNVPEDTLEKTTVVHFDLNGYYNIIKEEGYLMSYRKIRELRKEVEMLAERHGGLSYYAGGDNIICFIPHAMVKAFIDKTKKNGVKIGVGMAYSPRRALKLATEALEILRRKRSEQIVLKVEE